MNDKTYESALKTIDLSEILISSDVNLSKKYDDSYINCPENSKIKMKVEVSTGNKCPRCWKIFNTLNASGLCNRCESVLDEKS